MLRKWFERNGFGAALCPGVAAAQEALSQAESYKLVLSDLRLPDGDGIMLLNWVNEKRLSVPVIIMTGYGEIQSAVSAIKLGAFDFLEKPVNPDILTMKIEAACMEKQPEEQNFIEGRSLSYTQMYSHIDLVAPTQMVVMITGESGTGKEHVARLIHARSNRADKPFIAVDCGSLSMELAPSELFGHKKGSFTSAIEDKTGVFREADGGTLFLDEVGNLPYGVQMQLLRALQEKKVRPVGASADLNIDVRIITATNENLEKAIAKGTFREDLYHRLNEFMIRVPSLRECADDLPSYADHFRREANEEFDRGVTSISPEALAALQNYSWPGNLRELRNVIRRAMLFSQGDSIIPDNLPELTRQPAPNEEIPLFSEPEQEKKKILRALGQANGNKTKAAILLQIDRKTLYNKLHQYNLGL
jgi:two-component system response regulator HydG